jgi:hypothetical protein
MRLLVVYDVQDDRLRRRLARVLGGFGERVQRSAFECMLHPAERDRLERRLRALLPESPPEGGDETLPACSVRLYVAAGPAAELGAGATVVARDLVIV